MEDRNTLIANTVNTVKNSPFLRTVQRVTQNIAGSENVKENITSVMTGEQQLYCHWSFKREDTNQ